MCQAHNQTVTHGQQSPRECPRSWNPSSEKKTVHTFCQHVSTQENHSHHSKRYLSNSETLVLLSFEEPLEDASYFEKLTADMAMLVPLSTRRK